MDLSHFLMWTTIAQIALPFVLCVLLLPLERAFPRRPAADSLRRAGAPMPSSPCPAFWSRSWSGMS